MKHLSVKTSCLIISELCILLPLRGDFSSRSFCHGQLYFTYLLHDGVLLAKHNDFSDMKKKGLIQ